MSVPHYGVIMAFGIALVNCVTSTPPQRPAIDEAITDRRAATATDKLDSEELIVSGRVVDMNGVPLRGALAAAIGRTSFRGVAFARTDATGAFELRVAPGYYSFTATTEEGATGFAPPVPVNSESTHNDITIEVEGSGVTLFGTVAANNTGVPGARVRVDPMDGPRGATFYTETRTDGSYTFQLLEGQSVSVRVEHADYFAVAQRVFLAEDTLLDFPALSRTIADAPAPDNVVQWFRENAISLQTTEAGASLDDLRALGPHIGNARVVAMGEATHGTREFFQLKHRFFEYLVTDLGFTVFAIEANWSEALVLNDYVLHGKGDPSTALAGLHFWTWDTEEVLALIEWMREYNAANGPKLKFYGVDMQFTGAAASALSTYLSEVDDEFAKELLQTLEALRNPGWRSLPRSRQEDISGDLERAALNMEKKRRHYVRRSAQTDWQLARQHLAILRQAHTDVVRSPQMTSWDLREVSMADNLLWILDHEGKDARVFLWAHNLHVTKGSTSRGLAMGGYLADRLGQDYVSIGIVFGEGSFQAYDFRSPEQTDGVIEYTVGPPEPRFLEASLLRAGLPLFAIDLRETRAVEFIADWLDIPRPLRDYGAIYIPQDFPWDPIRVADHFDLLVFVEHTTRARPTPSGYRGPRSFNGD
jgi:erythromycin esterase